MHQLYIQTHIFLLLYLMWDYSYIWTGHREEKGEFFFPAFFTFEPDLIIWSLIYYLIKYINCL